METNINQNLTILIKGLVQGVGFRPFIYRSAVKNHISGWVKNRMDGVVIEVSGIQSELDTFIYDLKNNFPVAAHIHDIKVNESDKSHKNGFRIILTEKNPSETEITQIGPDIAVCDECLKDMEIQQNRLDYPFINCTNCGPRFSIIRDLPYDRDKTTMDVFEMCPVCKKEYENPGDRRFHAQPIACNDCGPYYKLIYKNKKTEELDEVLRDTVNLIEKGEIVAIKGVGGFFIACDAQNEQTIKLLRIKKKREGKPFAVMFRDVEAVQQLCFMSEAENKALTSWRRPVVILKSKGMLPGGVSNGITTIGALLPYMPFHYLLFEKLKTPAIIFTSGNFSDEPIVISNKQAEVQLANICDAVVSYNRMIYNRTDDSLLQIINQKPQMMRRSRGYAPDPVYLNFNVDGILATGAELKNTFCIGKGKQAILSQHIGDLKDFETYSFYEKNIEQFKKMFRVNPQLIVSDLHPEYLSTRYGLATGLPLVQVQHHHAHIASAMAEHGLDEKVIGVSFDGTGLGDDGNIWGSEFFICDLTKYERKLHFEYIPLSGGDKAIKEPWRIAVSWLFKVFGSEFLHFDLPFLKSETTKEINWVLKSIKNQLNSPLSSGAGRLFDAVSALLGLSRVSTFEAEAPMRLENIIDASESGIYSFGLSKEIEFSEMFSEIINDIGKGVNSGIISAKFHNTISEIIVAGTQKISKETGISKVVLSGGTFQNKYLTERTERILAEIGFRVYGNYNIPCNDGGIALGQLAIAAKRKSIQLQSQFIEMSQ